jgi:3-oxoacyl-[acyl-carrier protein] reductase
MLPVSFVSREAVMSLEGKVGIVTGGAQGIGKAYSERLAREGAGVAILDLRQEQAEDVAAGIRAAGGRALAVSADVADQESMDRAVGRVVEELGRVDILINNAAIYYDLDRQDQSLAYLRRVLDVNLIGILVCARAVFPYMKAQRSGSIINISSAAAYPRPRGPGGDLATIPTYAYGLAKSGVVYLTKSMAVSLGQYNIRVNAIAPGVTLSEATRKVVPGALIDELVTTAALGRALEPEDLTGVAAFLASDDSAMMTGQTLATDGGLVLLG